MTMQEDDWNPAEDAPAPRKRHLPGWLILGCGGCGGLLVVLAVVGGFLGFRWYKKASDPDVQWPKLEQVLPFDQRPTDVVLQMGTKIPPGLAYQFVLTDADQKLYVTVVELFDRDAVKKDMPGQPLDPVEGEMDLQGRSVTTLRYDKTRGEVSFGSHTMGPGVRVDLDTKDRKVYADFRKVGSKEKVTQDEIRHFFEGFDLWRQK